MSWLTFNYGGLRSLAEARDDLLTIANAPGRRSLAHVGVDPDGGSGVHTRGAVTADSSDADRFTVRVDGEAAFDFDSGSFRGAWLSTLDGADYYTLELDLGWGVVTLGDAYNSSGWHPMDGGDDR